eukprot:CAMPEP_0119306678 /NCGR_PEP_ID=MMETSP1333-20130426/7369_1 /TAXON_ID=418940 /ORGANISM="Scyphosphaera apsteinii, Strain RCC1455" /LENGTH=350 /DNA_ID=CAMNT_0007310037 /DNA_START=195 /DNA_END=1248 /DNA_ORIENTATION=+
MEHAVEQSKVAQESAEHEITEYGVKQVEQKWATYSAEAGSVISMINSGANSAEVSDFMRLQHITWLELYVRAVEDSEENGLSEAGLVTLAEALAADETLTKLVVYGEFGAQGTSAIADILRTNKVLSSLSLFSAQLGTEGSAALADALRSNGALSDLRLDYSSVGAKGLMALADVLRTAMLTSLCLSGTQLCDVKQVGADAWNGHYTAEGVSWLADAMRANTTLLNVGLDHNDLRAEGARAIADALEANCTLSSLNLRLNDIDDDGGVALADSLANNTSLKHLNLRDNQRLGWRTAAAFEAMLLSSKAQLVPLFALYPESRSRRGGKKVVIDDEMQNGRAEAATTGGATT